MLLGYWIRQVVRSERGAGLVEMSLLLILIAITALIAVRFAGEGNSQLWSEIGSGLDAAGN